MCTHNLENPGVSKLNPQMDGFRTAIFRTGDASRVWTAGGRGLDMSMRWEAEIIPLERISLHTELARFARSLIYRARVCTRDL